MPAVSLRLRRKAAAIAPWNILDPENTHDLLNEIDIALQIETMRRDSPGTFPVVASRFFQAEPLQNFFDALVWNRDAHELIAVVVTQRNVRRREGQFARRRNFR